MVATGIGFAEALSMSSPFTVNFWALLQINSVRQNASNKLIFFRFDVFRCQLLFDLVMVVIAEQNKYA